MSAATRAQQRAALLDRNDDNATALDDKYRVAEAARRTATPTRR